jgi:excisionase family DNA binding protein
MLTADGRAIEDKSVYKAEEVGVILGINVRAVRELVIKGKLRKIMIGAKKYKIPRSSIEEFLKGEEAQ